MKIVVGFSKSKKKFPIGGHLIRLYQGFTSYSHVYIRLLVKPRFPSDKIIHAAEGEVNHWSETNFHKRNETVDAYIIDIPDELYSHLRNDIFHEKAGEKYGMLQNLGIVWVDLVYFFTNKRINNPWQEGWNCSEFVATALKEVYPEDFNHLDVNLTTPKDIHKILKILEKEGKVKKYEG